MNQKHNFQKKPEAIFLAHIAETKFSYDIFFEVLEVVYLNWLSKYIYVGIVLLRSVETL